MELEFYKLSGAGNDFIAINNLDGKIVEQGRKEKVADWCRRGLSVGADGVLLIEPSKKAHFRMRYYNSDGSEGETCGNGSRCIARFANMLGIAPPQMRFETMAGEYEAEVSTDQVAVDMTDAHDLRSPIRFSDSMYTGQVYFINTGVPHVIVFVDDLQKTDVVKLGRHLRYHEQFAPAGTNVNFVLLRNANELAIRTYERGVEDETLACGTGSIASAIISNKLGHTQPPVRVHTAGGEVLTINFEPTDKGARKVKLQGGAKVVFRGYMEI